MGYSGYIGLFMLVYSVPGNGLDACEMSDFPSLYLNPKYECSIRFDTDKRFDLAELCLVLDTGMRKKDIPAHLRYLVSASTLHPYLLSYKGETDVVKAKRYWRQRLDELGNDFDTYPVENARICNMRFSVSKSADLHQAANFLRLQAKKENKNRKCCFLLDLPVHLQYLFRPYNSHPYLFYYRAAHVCVFQDWETVLMGVRQGYTRFLRVEIEKITGAKRAWFWGHTKLVTVYGEGETYEEAKQHLIDQYEFLVPEHIRREYYLIRKTDEIKRVMSCASLRFESK